LEINSNRSFSASRGHLCYLYTEKKEEAEVSLKKEVDEEINFNRIGPFIATTYLDHLQNVGAVTR
jgi:hypothetical protein